MKLSSLTIDALNNFNRINPSIILHPGNVIYSRTPASEMYAMARVPDLFETKAAIGDLREFLQLLKSYDNPEVAFEEKRVIIGDDKHPTYFPYALADRIATPNPDRKPGIKGDIETSIADKTFKEFMQRGMIRKYPHVAFVIEDSSLYLRALDFKQPSQLFTEIYLKDVGEEDPLVIGYTMENFNRILPRNYKISISKKGPAQFVSEGGDYTFIALHVPGLGGVL
jgi:hypothetical protein